MSGMWCRRNKFMIWEDNLMKKNVMTNIDTTCSRIKTPIPFIFRGITKKNTFLDRGSSLWDWARSVGNIRIQNPKTWIIRWFLKKSFKGRLIVQNRGWETINHKNGYISGIYPKLAQQTSLQEKRAGHFDNVSVFTLSSTILFRSLRTRFSKQNAMGLKMRFQRVTIKLLTSITLKNL